MRIIAAIIILHCVGVMNAQNDFAFNLNKGVESYKAENYTEGINYLNIALKNRKLAKNQYQVAGALMERSLCKMHLKQFSDAQKDVDEALKIKPEFGDLYFTKSLIYLKNKQYDDAIAWGKEGLKLKPTDDGLMMNILKANSFKKNHDEVIRLTDSLISNGATSAKVFNMKGEALSSQKKYKEAIVIYSKVIETDPRNVHALYSRAVASAYEKDFEGSLADMNRAIDLDTTARWIGYNNIGFFIKFEQKDYEGAIEYFNKAIQLQPNSSNAYNNRGYAKLQLNDLKGARADIDKAMQIEPENPYIYKYLGLYTIAENKSKQACQYFEKADKLGYTEQYDNEVVDLIKLHCNK